MTAADTTSSPIAALPEITLDKQAGTPTGATAGSTIDYTFLVTNTGNVTLDSLVINDPTVGSVLCPVILVTPGGSVTCTATYTLTQADVDAGHIANTATAIAAHGTDFALLVADATDTPLAGAPTLTLVKTAGTPSTNAAGGDDRLQLPGDQHRQRHAELRRRHRRQGRHRDLPGHLTGPRHERPRAPRPTR